MRKAFNWNSLYFHHARSPCLSPLRLCACDGRGTLRINFRHQRFYCVSLTWPILRLHNSHFYLIWTHEEPASPERMSETKQIAASLLAMINYIKWAGEWCIKLYTNIRNTTECIDGCAHANVSTSGATVVDAPIKCTAMKWFDGYVWRRDALIGLCGAPFDVFVNILQIYRMCDRAIGSMACRSRTTANDGPNCGVRRIDLISSKWIKREELTA